MISSLMVPEGAADFGWTAYTPLSGGERTTQLGGDLWVMGLALGGFGTILGAVNFITTIICMRAPGTTMFRMPIFTWNVLLTSVLVLLAFPVLSPAPTAAKEALLPPPGSRPGRLARRPRASRTGARVCDAPPSVVGTPTRAARPPATPARTPPGVRVRAARRREPS